MPLYPPPFGYGNLLNDYPALPAFTFHPAPSTFGATGNAKTLQDASMTNGLPTLTSASAPFLPSDVGKSVTVADGFGPAVTCAQIMAVTSATTVTLNQNANHTVSSAYLNYGTDDTAALQAWLNSITTNNWLGQLPALRYFISATLVINSGCWIAGEFSGNVQGSWALYGASSIWYPSIAPNLSGTVIIQGNANLDAFLISACAQSVNLSNLGVIFATYFNTTGHGFNCTPPTYLTGYDNGIVNSAWNNLKVFGHDGNHYAYYCINKGGFSLDSLISWGGGGLKIINNGQTNYGNGRISNLGTLLFAGGSANGLDLTCTLGNINFAEFTRVSIATLNLGQDGTTAIPGLTGATFSQYIARCDTACQYVTFPGSNDFETHLASGSSNIQLPINASSYAQASSDGLSGALAGNASPQANPVSGTVYQNTYGAPCLYCYNYTLNPTGGSAATVVVQMAATSGFTSPATVGTWSIPAAGPTGVQIQGSFVLFTGWYFKVTLTNATGNGNIALRIM